MDRTGVTELNHTLQQIPESFRSVGVKALLAFSPIFEPPLGWENGLDAVAADIQNSATKLAIRQLTPPPSAEGTSSLSRTNDSISVALPAEAANGVNDSPEHNTMTAADQQTSEYPEVMQLPTGESWSTVAAQLHKLTSKAIASQDQLSEGHEAEQYSVRLPEDDMDMYGFCPSTDGLVLVVCTHCSKTVRASRFAQHLDNCSKVRAASQNGSAAGTSAHSETSPQNGHVAGLKKKFEANGKTTKRIKTEPDAMDIDSAQSRYDDELYDENDFDPKVRQRKRKEADSHLPEPLAFKRGPGAILARSQKTKKESVPTLASGAAPLATRKKPHRNKLRGVLISLVPAVIMQYMKVNTPPPPSTTLVPTTVSLMPSALPVTSNPASTPAAATQPSTPTTSQPSPSTPLPPSSPQTQPQTKPGPNTGQAQKRARKKPAPKATVTKPNTPISQSQEPATNAPSSAGTPQQPTAAPIQSNLKSYYSSAPSVVTVQNMHSQQYVRPTELNRANNAGPPSPAAGVVMSPTPTPPTVPATQPSNPTLLATAQSIPSPATAVPQTTSSPHMTASQPIAATPAASGQVYSTRGYLTISNGGIIEGRPPNANLLLAQKAREQQQQQQQPLSQNSQVAAQTVGQAQRRPVEIRPHPQHHYQHMVMQPQQVTVPIGSPNVTNAH